MLRIVIGLEHHVHGKLMCGFAASLLLLCTALCAMIFCRNIVTSEERTCPASCFWRLGPRSVGCKEEEDDGDQASSWATHSKISRGQVMMNLLRQTLHMLTNACAVTLVSPFVSFTCFVLFTSFTGILSCSLAFFMAVLLLLLI